MILTKINRTPQSIKLRNSENFYPLILNKWIVSADFSVILQQCHRYHSRYLGNIKITIEEQIFYKL